MSALDTLLEEARKLNEQEKFAEAIELLNDEKFDKINDPEFYEVRAQAFWNLNNNEACILETEKILRIDSRSAIGNNYRGNLYAENKEYDKATECYKTAIKTNPGYKYPYNGLANVYLYLEQYEWSIEFYEAALKVDSKFQYPLNGLGNVYYMQENFDEAIKYFREAIKLNKKDPYPYNGLGAVYLRQRHYKEAIRQYTKAIKTDPAYPASYFNRGIVNQILKHYDEAKADFSKYAELTEKKSDFLTQLAKYRIRVLAKIIANPKYYGALYEIVEEIKDLLLYEGECVTHYTSLSVTSILILNNDSRFRLSEGAFLNDTSEGHDLFEFLPTIDKNFQYRSDTNAKSFVPKPFIGSFVTEDKHDDLTMWRMYGKENKEEARGCAITLDRAKLLNDLKKTLIPSDLNDTSDTVYEEFSFYRVAYKKFGSNDNTFIIPGCENLIDEKLNKLMGYMKAIINSYLDRKSENDIKDIYELVNKISYLFKSAQYQYEHELRLVVNGAPFQKKVDSNFSPPRVYVELINLQPLIKKITLGPKILCAEEWASGFYYILDQRKLHPEILISHLPFK